MSTTDDADATILAAAQLSEDVKAYADWFDGRVGTLMRLCGCNRHDAENAIQEACIEGLGQASLLRSRECARSWLFAVALRILAKHWRKSSRYELREASSDVEGGDDPAENLIQVEQQEALKKAMLAGSEGERHVMARLLAGDTVEEVSRGLAIPRPQVSRIKWRTNERLRDHRAVRQHAVDVGLIER